MSSKTTLHKFLKLGKKSLVFFALAASLLIEPMRAAPMMASEPVQARPYLIDASMQAMFFDGDGNYGAVAELVNNLLQQPNYIPLCALQPREVLHEGLLQYGLSAEQSSQAFVTHSRFLKHVLCTIFTSSDANAVYFYKGCLAFLCERGVLKGLHGFQPEQVFVGTGFALLGYYFAGFLNHYNVNCLLENGTPSEILDLFGKYFVWFTDAFVTKSLDEQIRVSTLLGESLIAFFPESADALAFFNSNLVRNMLLELDAEELSRVQHLLDEMSSVFLTVDVDGL